MNKKSLLAFILGVVTGLCTLVLFGFMVSTLNQNTPVTPLTHQLTTVLSSETNLSSDGRDVFIPQQLTLENIFSDNHEWIATLSAARIRTVIATGDVLPARTVNYKTVTKNNFTWPYEKTADVLKNADITLINLETPIIADCPLTNTGMIFCGDPKNIEGLIFAGIDIANFANNHAGNQGIEGVSETVSLLDSSGIDVAGVTGPIYREVKGMKFAFVGYNEVDVQSGVSHADEELIVQELQEANNNANIVISSFHWGAEYTTDITERQRRLAHLAIDNGADLIIGNHSHWIQPVEIYQGKLIVYAHGNFVFDQMWSQKTREGIVGKYTFYDDQLVDVVFMPVLIEDFGQPTLLENEEKTTILQDLYRTSTSLPIE
ncbi:CapA family protein [Candidatus Roizmanbacteria bacterium]|nr:CapA family protein [Candidatus Roizmanbacteria bacterium]